MVVLKLVLTFGLLEVRCRKKVVTMLPVSKSIMMFVRIEEMFDVLDSTNFEM
jgi:hypothetical protein